MDNKLLEHSLEFIQREIGRGVKYSTAQKEKIKESILNESPKALENAFDFIILNFTSLPTPQKLIESVRTEAAKLREGAWGQEKKELSRPLHAATPYGRECMKIIQQFFPQEDQFGFIPPVNYLKIIEEAQNMAIRHPHTDWPNIHVDWRDQWTAEGKLDPF